MASSNSTVHQGRVHIDIPNGSEIHQDAYCVALVGTDGKVVPGSRLSEDFEGLNAAFAALATMQCRHPNAAVFCSSGLTA